MSQYWGLGLAFLYMIAMIVVGFVVQKWIKNSTDFLASGREIGWFVLASGLAACQIAGTTVAGYPGTAYLKGWGAMWGALGWSMAALLFMFFFAKFTRRSGCLTIVEWFETKFGTTTRVIVAIGAIIALLFGGMAQYVGCGNIMTGWLGILYEYAVIIIGVATMIYMYTGGYWATVITDSIQFVICILAVYIVLPLVLVLKFGSLSTISASIPPEILRFPFGTVKFSDLGVASVTGLLCMNISFMWANSYYWGKSAAARSEKVAVKGYGMAALFIVPFAFVSTLAGLYVRAMNPDIATSDQVFGYLLSQMPALVSGFIMMAVLAATQSTITPIVIGNSTIITRDIICRIFPKCNSLKCARACTIILSIANMAMAIWYKSGALYGLAMMGAFVVPALPALILCMIAPKFVTKEAAVCSIGTSIPVGLYWVFLSGKNGQINCIYITFALAAVICVLVSLICKGTGPWWTEKNEKIYREFSSKNGKGGKSLANMRFEDACFEVAKPSIIVAPLVKWAEKYASKHRKDYVPQFTECTAP